MAARVTPATPLILGSQSPRRLELLRALRIPVEPFAVDVDESILPGERPDALATRLARQKGAATLYALGRSGIEGGTRWILCADTIVHIGGTVISPARRRPGCDATAATTAAASSGAHPDFCASPPTFT